MKSLSLLSLVAVLVGPSLPAQDLTPAEVNKAVQYLEKTRAGVLEATQGLSPAQWNYKPATNRWSVAEVAEHIAAAQDLLRDMIENQVLKAPVTTNAASTTAPRLPSAVSALSIASSPSVCTDGASVVWIASPALLSSASG